MDVPFHKLKGTGIVLWSARSLLRAHVQAMPPEEAEKRRGERHRPIEQGATGDARDWFTVDARPHAASNYSVLHNHGGLFERFTISKVPPGYTNGIAVEARLYLGAAKPAATGRILLFVHGTFSKSEALFDQLNDPNFPAGRDFLGRALQHYAQVLAFNHPTISVSPLLNALDLARLLADTAADIDVVCHSRGGLVTRWWLEAFDRGPGRRRVVLVGSPFAARVSLPHRVFAR